MYLVPFGPNFLIAFPFGGLEQMGSIRPAPVTGDAERRRSTNDLIIN